MTTDQIEQELLKLPAADRARIAERLIASLDEDSEVEAAWVAALAELDEAVGFYEERAPGLGRDFFDEVQRALPIRWGKARSGQPLGDPVSSVILP